MSTAKRDKSLNETPLLFPPEKRLAAAQLSSSMERLDCETELALRREGVKIIRPGDHQEGIPVIENT